MKLSTRSRYGTRILVELASCEEEVVPLSKLAARQNLPRAYVEHSIDPLVKAGIIATYRGVKGGISLGRPAEAINMSQIIKLLEGHDLMLDCINQPELCTRASYCLTRGVWKRAVQAIYSVLDTITLKNIVDEARRENNNAIYPNSEQKRNCFYGLSQGS